MNLLVHGAAGGVGSLAVQIANALRFLADGLKTGQITAQPDCCPLSSAAEAHRLLKSREVRGVVVLDPNTDAEETP